MTSCISCKQKLHQRCILLRVWYVETDLVLRSLLPSQGVREQSGTVHTYNYVHAVSPCSRRSRPGRRRRMWCWRPRSSRSRWRRRRRKNWRQRRRPGRRKRAGLPSGGGTYAHNLRSAWMASPPPPTPLHPGPHAESQRRDPLCDVACSTEEHSICQTHFCVEFVCITINMHPSSTVMVWTLICTSLPKAFYPPQTESYYFHLLQFHICIKYICWIQRNHSFIHCCVCWCSCTCVYSCVSVCVCVCVCACVFAWDGG